MPVQHGGVSSRFGLTAKLLACTILALLGATLALSLRATTQLEQDLTDAFVSKGQAIALSMAAAAERSAKGDPLILQNSIESNRHLQGVSYIYVQDPGGRVVSSTFVENFPSGLAGT